jgi:HAMP domain-containing protein
VSDIDLGDMDTLAWLLVAACVVIGGGFLFFVWRWIDKRKGNGGKD